MNWPKTWVWKSSYPPDFYFRDTGTPAHSHSGLAWGKRTRVHIPILFQPLHLSHGSAQEPFTLTFLCCQGLKGNREQKTIYIHLPGYGKEMQEPAVPASAQLAVALTHGIAFYDPALHHHWKRSSCCQLPLHYRC